MKKNIRERAKQGMTSFGINLALGDPITVEMAARAGYDFVRIDCEHVLFDATTLMNMIRTARLLELPVQVRVSGLYQAGALLDMGVSGLMVPHIGNREAALTAVNAVKYAPLGQRGMTGASRALNFGQYKMSEYSTWANDEVSLIIQIEDRDGLEHMDEILSVEGVDMVATGRNDLSQALGVPGQNTHPEVLAAEDQVIRKAIEYGKIPTLLVRDRKRLGELWEKGVRCFTIARDETLLAGAMKSTLAEMREEIKE
ncbi:MAG: aldolase/citrate lyase family protein [Lachnospiraceae bacterium]|nr:aldolase/citrate lyase family protein [Lachnospiraceae bacterium]